MSAQPEQLFAQHGRVEELELDIDLQDHLSTRGIYSKHTVSLNEILEVHQGNPKYFENIGRNKRAPIIMVGVTLSDRVLCIPIEPTGVEGRWRVVTAFEANTHHKERYLEQS